MNCKGLILAGGNATRLYPITIPTNKHLLPIFSKPMIYYPLATLMLAEQREIIIVTNQKDVDEFKNLLGNGNQFGLNINYAVQEKADGLSSAISAARKYIENCEIKVILGDNVFYGKGLEDILNNNLRKNKNVIFTQNVSKPESFGVLKRDEKSNIHEIIEKPRKFVSNEAVLGLYFYDNSVLSKIENLKYSSRGELEITDLNNSYLKEKNMDVVNLGRGISWYDAGTVEDLHSVSTLIKEIEVRQSTLISSIEEIALRKNFISESSYLNLVKKYKNNYYAKKLLEVLD